MSSSLRQAWPARLGSAAFGGAAAERVAVVGVVALAVLLRIAVTWTQDLVADGPDAINYLRMAETLATSGSIRDLYGNVAFYNAGYPLLLAPVFWLFGTAPELAQLPNVLLGGLSVWLVFLCARELLPDWRWALLPALFWATYPPALLYTEYASKENLMIPLMVLGGWFLLRFPRARHKVAMAFAMGLVFGATVLSAAATLPMVAVFVWVILFAAGKTFGWGRRLLGIMAFGLGLVLSLGPWLAYTQAELGRPVVTSSGGFNLYLGNNANQSDGLFMSISDTPIGTKGWAELRREFGELGASSALGDEAVAYALTHPLRTAALGVKKLVMFWYPPVHTGKGGDASRLETLMRQAWLAYYVPAVLLAVVALFLVDWRDPRAIALFGAILLYWAVHGIVYVIFRYRLPIMPLVACAATWALWLIYMRFTARGSPAPA